MENVPGWRLGICVVNEEPTPNITWRLRIWSGRSMLGSEREERVGLGGPRLSPGGQRRAGLCHLRGDGAARDGAERCRSHKRERAGAQERRQRLTGLHLL